MPALDTDSEADMMDKSEAPVAVAAASRSPTPPPADVEPPVNFNDSPARLDTPDLPDDMIDPVPAILSVDLAADTASPSSALQMLVDLALEDAQPTPGRVEYAPQDATFAGGALTVPPPSAASLPPPPEPWVSVPVVTCSTSFANVGVLATSASVPPVESRAPVSTVMSPTAIATAALAAFFASYMPEAAPLPAAPPHPVDAAVPADVRDANDALSSWLEQHGAENYQMSLSSGEISAFDPVPNTSANYSAPHVSARPTLQARDAVNVARSTLGMEETQLLVPSILRISRLTSLPLNLQNDCSGFG